MNVMEKPIKKLGDMISKVKDKGFSEKETGVVHSTQFHVTIVKCSTLAKRDVLF